jgi:hypothetical protein
MSVAAADVHGLAAVCHAALSGVPPYRDGMLVPLRSVAAGVPPVLIEAIESAMNPEFRSRPDAAAFARALYAACTPRPVALESPAPVEPAPAPLARVEVAPPDAPSVAKARGDRRRRLRRHVRTSGRHASRVAARRLAMPLLAAGLLAAAVLVGVAWAGHDRSAAASAQAAGGGTSSDSSWLRVMSTLDEARDQAFADGDPDELVGVYVAGSPALTADRQTLGAMVDAGQRARDLGLTLVSVQVRARTSTTVELLVRDTLPSYEIVDADGEIRRQPGRAERAWLVTLEAAGAGGSWRIATIDAA